MALDTRDPYRRKDPCRQELGHKEQQRREHIIFRSFLTGEEKKGSLMAPVQRRPGLRQAGSAGFGCLAKGSEVQLENLSRRELNGLKGTVVTDKPDEFGRIYVDIGGGKSFRVLKISPDRLKRAGESETRPAWMPAGRQGLEEMGASHWSASGIRTGFPGFGILQSKQWQSTPELREKHHQLSRVSHRSYVRTVCGGFMPEPSAVRSFTGQASQLEHALLAVVRANSMNEVLYAPMCGLVLVTKVEDQALQLLCPAPPPLPASYLLVGDFKNLKFIDI
ncbi:unnamed protein product [Effrenium voratum]|nr:unnamed protein product [Effrenium voratum]